MYQINPHHPLEHRMAVVSFIDLRVRPSVARMTQHNTQTRQTNAFVALLQGTIFVFISAFSLTTSEHAVAETFMWTDENGVVNYAERKPRNVPESRIQRIGNTAPKPSSSPTPSVASNPTPTSSAGSPANRTGISGQPGDLDAQQQAMLQELQAAEATRQEQVARIRQENCSRARRVLGDLQSLGRIRVVNEAGEPRVMTEDERSERIARAQEGVAANCES